MTQLRADITGLLFFNPDPDGTLNRRVCTDKTLHILDRMSDVEALTACMGLVREAEHRNDEYQHFRAAGTALGIFLRLAGTLLLLATANLILEYLSSCFFSAKYAAIPRPGPAAGGVDLKSEIGIRHEIMLMLEDFGVLRPIPAHGRACLHLADVYGLRATHRELIIPYLATNWRGAKSVPIVRWFTRHLRSFEFTTSCLDGTPISSPVLKERRDSM